MTSSEPLPAGPGSGPIGPSGAKDPESRGCMKWGLVGCAGLSVIAIIGMVLFLRKAPQLMETLLGATEAQVVSAIAPEVPAAEKEAFRAAYAGFVASAKAGKARPEEIQALQKKILESTKDGSVSSEELRALTGHLGSMSRP